VAIVAAVVSGLGLLGGSVHGMASLDGRLAEATPPAQPREVDVRQELQRHDGDCPARKQRRQTGLTEL
jgi:hypothetical protein